MKYPLFLLLSFSFFTSCQNNEKNISGANTASSTESNSQDKNNVESLLTHDGKLQFRLRPSTGKKYHYTITTSSNTNIEAPTKNIASLNEMEAAITYENIKDSAGFITLKLTYNKLHIEIKKGDDEKVVIDADTPEEEQTQTEQILRTIKSYPLYINLNPKGVVLNISGTKEITEKIMKGVVGNDIQMQRLVQQLINRLAGNDFVEENIKSAFFLLPDTVLAAGSKWKKSITQNADLSFISNVDYKLESLEDGIAQIIATGTIGTNTNEASVIMGQQVTTNLTGEQSANFKIDLSSGMLQYNKSKTTISGTVTVQGHELPLTIKMKKEISLQ